HDITEVIGIPAIPPPPAPPAFQPAYGGGDTDAFVARLDPSGSRLLTSGYLGGPLADSASGVTLDGKGNAYVSGYSISPVTIDNSDGTGGRVFAQAFVAKVAFDGRKSDNGPQLLWQTVLGSPAAETNANGVAVDQNSNVFVTGYTTDSTFALSAPVLEFQGGG